MLGGRGVGDAGGPGVLVGGGTGVLVGGTGVSDGGGVSVGAEVSVGAGVSVAGSVGAPNSVGVGDGVLVSVLVVGGPPPPPVGVRVGVCEPAGGGLPPVGVPSGPPDWNVNPPGKVPCAVNVPATAVATWSPERPRPPKGKARLVERASTVASRPTGVTYWTSVRPVGSGRTRLIIPGVPKATAGTRTSKTARAPIHTRVRERRLSAAVGTRGNCVVGCADGGTIT